MARTKTEKYDCEKMCEIIEDYLQHCISHKKVPVFKEITVKQKWNYSYVWQLKDKEGYEDLKETIQRLIDAKEWMLESLGLTGKIDRTMAVFSLKQLGWKDNQIVDIGENAANNLKIKLVVAE